MALILLFTALLATLLWLNHTLRRRSPGLRLHYQKLAYALLTLVLTALAASGRLPWPIALILALPPLIRLGLLWRKHDDAQERSSGRSSTANDGMSRQEAFEILGLTPEATREDIVRAHRGLMQKLHPDRGGNHYLASRINRAKDLLLP